MNNAFKRIDFILNSRNNSNHNFGIFIPQNEKQKSKGEDGDCDDKTCDDERFDEAAEEIVSESISGDDSEADELPDEEEEQSNEEEEVPPMEDEEISKCNSINGDTDVPLNWSDATEQDLRDEKPEE